MAAGKLLEELGLVARKQNSDCNRTYQYLLQVETVQERVNYPTQVLMNCEWGGGLSLKFNNELKQVYMSNDGQSVAQPSA